MTIYGDQNTLDEKMGWFEPYYLGIALFAVLSVIFSFGNIENSKGLQLVSCILRFTSIFLMIGASLITIFVKGVTPAKDIKVWEFDEISELFGNTIFIFIVHHSVPGIVYPI